MATRGRLTTKRNYGLTHGLSFFGGHTVNTFTAVDVYHHVIDFCYLAPIEHYSSAVLMHLFFQLC